MNSREGQEPEGASAEWRQFYLFVLQLRGILVEFLSGTLRKNVSLLQKSRRTSIERSFFAECPGSPGTLHKNVILLWDFVY
jgi:hypothetical protein